MSDKIANLRDWYIENRDKYRSLADYIKNILQGMLISNSIQYMTILSRSKTVKSLLNKAERKNYPEPKDEIFDFSGIRIITYLESDARKVCALIEKEFSVDKTHSVDKGENLGTDKVGYKSVHFICKLKSPRLDLPEASIFRDMIFEVQVRTVLQHAWAEIEHDRRYKLSSRLPEDQSRHFNLLAASLELLDKNFDSLALQIDNTIHESKENAAKGVVNSELNLPTLVGYLEGKLGKIKITGDNLLFSEIEKYGIKTLEEIDEILNNLIKSGDYQIDLGKDTDFSIIRTALMLDDIDRFFAKVYPAESSFFDIVPEKSYLAILKKYGVDKLKTHFSSKSLKIVSPRRAPGVP